MKYFLLGAFSSGILLYGMSLLYGIAGSTNLGQMETKLAAAPAELRPVLLLGMIALAAGLFFKIAAVPFHMWAPDAYEGAPTSVTAFLSTGSKAASFALYARIFIEALPSIRADWAPLLGLVAALTIMVGNWAAVTQENSKRLLAYSSISNAGYLLLGLVAGNSYGYIGLVIYLLVYTLMNMGGRVADEKPLSLSPALQAALVASLVGILFIGVYPQPLIEIVQRLIGPLAAVGPLSLK